MIEQLPLLTALVMGLMGGVHCAGMCGGIVGAITLTLQPGKPATRPRLPFILAYNSGRILSYTLAGALMGALGQIALSHSAMHESRIVLYVLAGLFMIATSFYIGGWWHGLARVEKLGKGLWRTLEPFGRKLLPVRTLPQAMMLGLIWGWLPCGLVYSALIFSLSADSIAGSASIMLAFGLGTLPNLVLMGYMAARLSHWLRRPWVRHGAGLMLLLFAFVTLYRAWSLL